MKKKPTNINMPSNKNFGITFSIIFFLLFLFFFDSSLKYIFFTIFIIFLFFSLFAVNKLSKLNQWWFQFGIVLSSIISPIVMGVIFFGVVTPISFLMKILKKDFLNIKKNSNDTYWFQKQEKTTNLKNQF